MQTAVWCIKASECGVCAGQDLCLPLPASLLSDNLMKQTKLVSATVQP